MAYYSIFQIHDRLTISYVVLYGDHQCYNIEAKNVRRIRSKGQAVMSLLRLLTRSVLRTRFKELAWQPPRPNVRLL